MKKSPNAIETQHLRKEFADSIVGDNKVAVADLTLTVERGEVFGFLGPNGAGKTTSVKMLLGLITPTSGTGTLFGQALNNPQARAKVGFLPEHFRFHEWLKATEFLQLHADLYRMPRATSQRRIPELLDLVGLTAHAGRKLRTFSKGMLQRIGLAQALLNEPDLVFLDEPTSGLDPMGRRLVRDIIHTLQARGTTVFLNSHLLSEVEVTCNRVAFIKQGQIVQVSALNDLVAGSLTVDIRAKAQSEAQWDTVLTGLQQWSKTLQANGEHITLTLNQEADLPAITRFLVESQMAVYAITPQRVSLEEFFIQTVGEEEVRSTK